MFRILTILSLLLAGLYQPCCGCCHAASEQIERADSAVACPACAKSDSGNTPQRKGPCRHRKQSRFSNVIAEQDLVPVEPAASDSAATSISTTFPPILPEQAVSESKTLRSVSLTVLHCRYQC